MKPASKLAALLVLGAGLAGCDIGEGSTIEKFEIVPATSSTQLKTFEIGDDYNLYQCLRDELLVRATFTDGTLANFSARASWSSSDPSVVQVSDGDISAVLAAGSTDGEFFVADALKYGKGTVIPVGQPGQTAVITARFASLSASINVEIRKPKLRLIAVPEPNPDASVSPYYLAARTTQRLSLLADLGGRTARLSDLAGGGTSNGFNINPFRIAFTNGTFIPEDPDIDDDVDLWVVEDSGGDRVAEMLSTTTDAFVEGVKAENALHEVEAESYLCPAGAAGVDAELAPVADIQVGTFYDDPGTAEDDRIILSREPGFIGSGFAVEDQVIGSSQRLGLVARVDARGDGSLIVDQNLSSQAATLVQPQNESCQDVVAQLGCSANKFFTLSLGVLQTTAVAEEGGEARVRACFPFCLAPKANLQASATSVALGVPVDFTATELFHTAGVTTRYVFDFGDGTTVGPQASNVASHAYSVAGAYTATVRLEDAAYPGEIISPNAGAVRVLAATPVTPGNTAPVADLEVTIDREEAPTTATFDATGSTDPQDEDSITVFEFDPGDGTGPIRQSHGLFFHTYLDGTGSPFTPTLKVYDESGAVSATVSGDPITITGTAPPMLRSNVLPLRARAGTLCGIELLPGPGAAPTQEAFTHPGLQFQAMGSFVLDTDTDTCDDLPIGTQLVTRFMDWAVFPTGTTDVESDVVFVRTNSSDYDFPGQLVYTSDVTAPTTFDVTATPISLSDDDLEATPTTLTVLPCSTCTP